MRQPVWVIRDASQLRVEGNKFLSAQTIRNLVPLKYPQSIFRTQPNAIAEDLKRKAPLSAVQIDRQLFPPELIVRVTEQTPVAAVHSKNEKGGQPSATPDQLLDAQGNTIPIERYQSLEQGIQLPALRVLGDPKEYRQYWSTLFQHIQQNQLSLQQVDWRDSSNLILTTEVGPIHLGPYQPPLFVRQIRAIKGLQSLTQKVPSNQIDYIDLRNPDAPALQKNQRRPVRLNLLCHKVISVAEFAQFCGRMSRKDVQL
ncbi:MAG: FtsQ-type POTRA domain-containing protein [Alkalinema sp. RL_2_19]|nr:FtsQ-type POTRA domain-containing protein [Alkalinema sp. RL_2_19]